MFMLMISFAKGGGCAQLYGAEFQPLKLNGCEAHHDSDGFCDSDFVEDEAVRIMRLHWKR